jgi:hypothetical protein
MVGDSLPSSRSVIGHRRQEAHEICLIEGRDGTARLDSGDCSQGYLPVHPAQASLRE